MNPLMRTSSYSSIVHPPREASLDGDPVALAKDLEALFYEGERCLEWMSAFVERQGNVNLVFPEISLGDNVFHNPTFFHLVYLCWKQPEVEWEPEIEERFSALMDQMLESGEADLHATFSEHDLYNCEHFFNPETQAYRDQNMEEGYLMERVTLAHYAAAIRDFEMVVKLVESNPELLSLSCCLVKGKNLLHYEVMSVASFAATQFGKAVPDVDNHLLEYNPAFDPCLERLFRLDDRAAGEIAVATIGLRRSCGMLYSVTRSVGATCLHLAARLGDGEGCAYLLSKGAKASLPDSDGRTPLGHFELSVQEGFVKPTALSKSLVKLLQGIFSIEKPLDSPQLPKYCALLKRSNYTVCYDTRTKVPIYSYERLTRASFQRRASRRGVSFRVDRSLPPTNRSTQADYAGSGWDRGHLAPAARAVALQQAMADTFLLTNVAPQNPNLNRGYWKRMERAVQMRLKNCDLLEVFTGCLFLPELCEDGKKRVSYEVIGEGNVAVPTHFFTVMFANNSRAGEAYILPNSEIAPATPLEEFQESAEKVQQLSGILFSEWRK